MSAALVATFLNEAKTIDGFLESLAAQTRVPDEIVFVDGGSDDGTIEKVLAAIDKGLKARLIADHCNRARGRNLAVGACESEIIAVTDAGCILDPDWFREITAPLETEPEYDVAGGICVPSGFNSLQRSVGKLLIPEPCEIDAEKFFPSSRNIAFRRGVFVQAGGYPEEFDFNEDTVFAVRLRKQGFKIFLQPKARVRWLPPSTFREALGTFYNYGRGDGQAGTYRDLYGRIGIKYSALAVMLGMGAVTRGGARKKALAAAAVIMALERPRFFRKAFSTAGVSGPLSMFPLKWLRDLTLMTGWLRGAAERKNKL